MAAAGLAADAAPTSGLAAAEPPEARGLKRDDVRLLVSQVGTDSIEHARFRDLPRWFAAGDLLVVNTSGTLNAALTVAAAGGEPFELHLSTQLPGGFWVVELREPGADSSLPCRNAQPGTTLRLPGGARAAVLAPYPLAGSIESTSRLWIAALQLPAPAPEYLERFGFPIRYSYVKRRWPSSAYQTVFATEPGSAEMPSAGRPFTPELVTRLVSRGVQFAPILLHTGVASQEDHEPPYEEFFRVTRETADLVNAARRGGHRIVAVGTTVVRALETVTDERGTSPGEGWTSVVVRPGRPVLSVNGMITGLHDPRATHLMMLQAVMSAAAGSATSPSGGRSEFYARRHLDRAYAEAATEGYLWHEFGDSHLIIG